MQEINSEYYQLLLPAIILPASAAILSTELLITTTGVCKLRLGHLIIFQIYLFVLVNELGPNLFRHFCWPLRVAMPVVLLICPIGNSACKTET